MTKKTKTVKRGKTAGAVVPGAPGWDLVVAEGARHALVQEGLKLVEQLALYWVAEGRLCDEPGSSKEAFELLIKHGYAVSVGALGSPAKLRRPDGSEVTR